MKVRVKETVLSVNDTSTVRGISITVPKLEDSLTLYNTFKDVSQLEFLTEEEQVQATAKHLVFEGITIVQNKVNYTVQINFRLKTEVEILMDEIANLRQENAELRANQEAQDSAIEELCNSLG